MNLLQHYKYTLMKNTTTAKQTGGMPIKAADAMRLIMEIAEEMGEHYEDKSEMMRRMRHVLREGVRAVKAAEQTVCFEQAAWESVESRADRRPTTRRDLRHFVRRMLRVEGMAVLPLRRMTTRDCRHLLQSAFGSSRSSYRKGRAILHSIFAFGMRHEWCDSNPVDRIETPQVQEKHIEPLSLQEIARLHAVTRLPEHAPMHLSLHLMLYCGLRPNEVQRLQPGDIRWAEREVLIRPSVSKTGGGRVVPLRIMPSRTHENIPGNWAARWRALRKAAGFTHWQADACRHSFASYHAAFFRDLPTLQWEMGHRNLQLLCTRYISPVPRLCAQQYWRTYFPNFR